MLNFSEIRTQVQNLIERPDSAFQSKIDGFINSTYRYIVGMRPWLALLRPLEVTTTAAQNYIITPQWVDKIIDIYQTETPSIIALQRFYTNLSRNLGSLTQQDVPTNAYPMGEIGIKVALPSNGTITIESSSASDTTPIITVRGYNTSLLPISENITLNGTSAVTSSNTYVSTEGYEPKFSKDSDTIGFVTIKRSSTTIAELSQDERDSRYKKWKLWPIPKGATTLYLTVKKKTFTLERNGDTPELECDNCLILGAFARSLQEKRQMGKANQVWGKVDANGHYTSGTFMAELEDLISREPQFGENFQDQFIPLIQRDSVDMQPGYTNWQLRPSN